MEYRLQSVYNHMGTKWKSHIGPINVRSYKGRTVQKSDLQTSDWYKRQTGTNVGLVQTADWDKRQD